MPLRKEIRNVTWSRDTTFHWPRKKGSKEDVALTDRQAQAFVDEDVAKVEGFKKSDEGEARATATPAKSDSKSK